MLILHTNLDAPTRNLQNIKDKHADQTVKEKSATPYLIHVLPLLNHVARNNSFSTKTYTIQVRYFVQCYKVCYIVLKCWFCCPDKSSFCTYTYKIRISYIYIYIYIHKICICMCVYTHTYFVCISAKSAFVRTTKSALYYHIMHSITLNKNLIYIYIYIRAVYTYINVRTTCTRTGSRCNHSVYCLATALARVLLKC
jgi:hypothetical protein